jgi:hypothetical protein
MTRFPFIPTVFLAVALAGCATPVLQPSVDVPGWIAQSTTPAEEPEVAWWKLRRLGLTDLIHRAAGARQIAARACALPEPGDHQPLAACQHRCYCSRRIATRSDAAASK